MMSFFKALACALTDGLLADLRRTGTNPPVDATAGSVDARRRTFYHATRTSAVQVRDRTQEEV